MADKPVTREEMYLAYLTGDYTGEIPKPITRKEKYLYELCLKGMGGEISPEEIQKAVNDYLEKNPVKPGATTEQAQQIEQNKTDIASLKTETSSLKEDISNKISKFYASNQGKTHITDSDNGKIQDMMIYGKSSQDGTPTPDNPVEIKSVVNPIVKVVGKNLLNATLQTTTQNGVTCTNNGDGTYTLNGTAKSQTIFNLFNINENIYGGKLITGCQPGGGRNTFNIVIVYYTKDRKWASEDYEVDNGKIIKIKNESSYLLSIGILVRTGYVCNNVIFKPMIVEGAASAYEPYHEQTVTLPYTLNAIPVSSGGNVTIDSQQYIADYVDVEHGKLVRMCKKEIVSGVTSDTKSAGSLGWVDVKSMPYDSMFLLSEEYTFEANSENAWYSKFPVISFSKKLKSIRIYDTNLKMVTANIIYVLNAPIEIDLTKEEITAFKTLATYYPTTNISINSEQLDGYTVFNYPISMKNGWNYVKQQIGDTRDYIYDMDARTQDTDLQAAEAYVNSEYAVALTELEV